MTQLLDIFKCEVCGNIVELVHSGAGALACCNQPMKIMQENTTDASQEKHVPVINKIKDGIEVKVGSIPHPMEEKHYIEWIEVISGPKTFRNFLKPGEAPESKFYIEDNGNLIVREYCNLHGLWRVNND